MPAREFIVQSKFIECIQNTFGFHRKKLAIVIVHNQQSFSYKDTVFPMGSIALFVSHGMVYNRIGKGDGAPRFLDAIDSER